MAIKKEFIKNLEWKRGTMRMVFFRKKIENVMVSMVSYMKI